MGWGQVPSEAKAAEEARREAIELAESRPMSPFERKLIGVLEDIRDRTAPGAERAADKAALDEALVAGYCAGVVSLDPLLDSPPAVLARAIQAGGAALANSFPMFREDLTTAGFEKFAEVAIEAALNETARDRDAEADLTLGAAERPKRRVIDFDLRFGPVSPATLADEYWRGPGIYTLKSTAAQTQFHLLTRADLAEAIGQHPIHPPTAPETSAVQQGSGDEAGGGEPHEGPPPAAP